MLKPTYDAWIVLLSVVIAILAAFVALHLAGRVRTRDRSSGMVWTIGGALVMGSGIWSTHFVGMLAFRLPIPLGYAPGMTFLSWAAAVTVSAVALHVAAFDRLRFSTLTIGALTMGVGIGSMHYLGMAAMDMQPAIVWDPLVVAASVLFALTASVVALLVFFGLRRLKGAYRQMGHAAAAVLMGLAISGMHYTGMAAAGFPVGSVCGSADGLTGSLLVALVATAVVLLLSSTLFTSALDARMEGRAHRLARSLRSANHKLQGANAELQRIAFRDPLTGVPNRVLFEDRLGQAIARVARQRAEPASSGMRLALLFIDLDGFKPVNDVQGHAAGDELLRQVATRLSSLVRECDTVARIGGDEFVLLVTDLSSATDANSMAERVLQRLNKPFALAGRMVSVSCSIGVALHPDHVDGSKVMAAADAAMYRAKRAGGGAYVVFEKHMLHGAAELFDLQQALRMAVDLGQMQLHFQPIVDASTGRIRGVEALARWTHPQRGPISPGVFVPIAERFGLIVPIGNWVIDEACRQLGRWAREKRFLRVAVNLSRHQLRQPDLVQRIARSIRDNRIEPEQLIFEVTESAAMEDTQATQLAIEQFARLGVKLSIDDFGTGYSSLATLRQLRTHEIKIDRSFVLDVATSPEACAVIDAIVRLAHALDLRVVAEGVETAAQRDVLIALGCDLLQGFYFARPMPASALTDSEMWTADGAAPVEFSPSAYAGLGDGAGRA